MFIVSDADWFSAPEERNTWRGSKFSSYGAGYSIKFGVYKHLVAPGPVQNDCIKTLYEIGYANPDLVAKYYKDFGKLLESKNNRLVWGGMTALDTIALKEPKGVHGILSKMLDAADNSGSVIARDHAVGILAKLATLKLYRRDCIAFLLEQLMSCPDNQFPMYVEMSAPVIDAENREKFRKVIEMREPKLDKESQRKRVARVLKKLG